MRIISSFFDYYDKGIAFGIDEKQIYVRETKETLLERGSACDEDFKNDLIGMGFTFPEFKDSGVIAFCGKAYPFFRVRLVAEYIPGTDNSCRMSKTYYSIDSMEKDIRSDNYLDRAIHALGAKTKAEVVATKSRVESLRDDLGAFLGKRKNRGKRYFYGHPTVSVDFDETWVGRVLDDETFIKNGAPIILAQKTGRGGQLVLKTNPRLLDYEFIKVFDPIAAFQEISMYLGNNMAKQVDPSENFSDDMKRDAAGFDKWSFRKHKNDRKK